MIHARSLSITRGERRVVDNVDLSVERGQVWALLGRNGAGKSSLLRGLARDLEPSAGCVDFAGHPLNTWTRPRLARHVAVLEQTNLTAFPFRVEELVAIGRLPHGDANLAEHVERALCAVGIDHLRHRDVMTLSGGERQLAHLARALCQLDTPGDLARLLLLDEPITGLDVTHQHEALQRAGHFAETGGAVIMVLHDFQMAQLYATHVAVLQHGHLAAAGPRDEVLRPALLKRVFGIDVSRVVAGGRVNLVTLPLGDAPDTSEQRDEPTTKPALSHSEASR